MKILGVTGNIGSGKSLFCSYLQAYGAKLFNADQVAKNLMSQDPRLIAQIRLVFGEEAYHHDGSLNRSWLAEQAFNRGRVDELNAIVHPAVDRETQHQVQQARETGCPLFVKEAALLLNEGRPAELDYVVWIQSALQDRILRVVKRDQSNPNLVLERDEKQKKLAELAPLIDEIVINDGTPTELREKAEKLYAKLVG